LLISFGFGRHAIVTGAEKPPVGGVSALKQRTDKNSQRVASFGLPPGERQNTRFGGNKPIN